MKLRTARLKQAILGKGEWCIPYLLWLWAIEHLTSIGDWYGRVHGFDDEFT